MDERRGDIGSWSGDGLRREAFFFESGGKRLYGSLYAAATPTHRGAVALCNSWGFEGNQTDATIQAIALATARGGGAALVFHYPGFGDSEGEPAKVAMEHLVAAALAALDAGGERLHEPEWTLAGTMFGAPVAVLAAPAAGVERLLLIQPALRAGAYFRRLERSARRAAIRVPERAGNAYGYPLPKPIATATPAIEAAVSNALAGFAGSGAVVRYSEPPRDALVPASLEDVVLPGTWRFGARQKPELAKAASEWLRRGAAGASA